MRQHMESCIFEQLTTCLQQQHILEHPAGQPDHVGAPGHLTDGSTAAAGVPRGKGQSRPAGSAPSLRALTIAAFIGAGSMIAFRFTSSFNAPAVSSAVVASTSSSMA